MPLIYTDELHGVCAGKYTIIGHVIDGLDTLDKMEKIPSGMEALSSSLYTFKPSVCINHVT